MVGGLPRYGPKELEERFLRTAASNSKGMPSPQPHGAMQSSIISVSGLNKTYASGFEALKSIDLEIREGEIFLLPPKVPHNPIRGADTVGLVIERQRRDGELDGLLWYCENCNSKLYEEYFQLEDITTQFQGVFERFYSNEELRTCGECGAVMEPPVPAK